MGNMHTVLLRLAAWFIALLIALTIPIMLRIPVPGDWALVEWALGLRNDALTQVVQLLTFITSAAPALLICASVSSAYYFIQHRAAFHPPSTWKHRLDFVLMAAWPLVAYAGALASNIALRIAIGRARPGVDYIPHGLPELQADFQRFSYPSGHAGAAVVAFVSLAALAWPHKRLRWPVCLTCALVIAGTGFGRVYLGVHWPTDVIAGYLLASAWLAIALRAACKS